jgi:hypothetical protein
MRYFLDILQAAGVGSATGIRPFLPALVAGALGRANAGVDFEGTSFAFLESPVFLAALVVGVVVSLVLRRRRPDNPQLDSALSGIGIGLGALFGAGTMDDRFSVWWPGLVVGGLRVRARLDREARAALPAYEAGAGMLVAGACIALPPLAVVVLGFLVWLLLGSRRRGREKYAGLRILR